jgi:hypothetical protein
LKSTDQLSVSLSAENGQTAPVCETKYDAVRFNAIKHGILSRHTVLPHEDQHEFADLLAALMSDHQPSGATEFLLVEELASIVWRKRRVLQAENASLNRGMLGVTSDANSNIAKAAAPFESGMPDKPTDMQDVMTATRERIRELQQESRDDLENTYAILKILRKGEPNAYDTALAMLSEGTRELWYEFVEAGDYRPTLQGLTSFVHSVLPISIGMEREARHYLSIRAQTLGEALRADRLEKLSRYETHLDRKLERTLAMLIKLQELRSNNSARPRDSPI